MSTINSLLLFLCSYPPNVSSLTPSSVGSYWREPEPQQENPARNVQTVRLTLLRNILHHQNCFQISFWEYTVSNILLSCHYRLVTNKLLLSVIIIMELAILAGVVYLKFFRKQAMRHTRLYKTSPFPLLISDDHGCLAQ